MTDDDKLLVESLRGGETTALGRGYAADRIEALTAENERLAEAGAKQAFEVGVLREALDWMSNSEPLVVEAILSRVSAALGDTQ